MVPIDQVRFKKIDKLLLLYVCIILLPASPFSRLANFGFPCAVTFALAVSYINISLAISHVLWCQALPAFKMKPSKYYSTFSCPIVINVVYVIYYKWEDIIGPGQGQKGFDLNAESWMKRQINAVM